MLDLAKYKVKSLAAFCYLAKAVYRTKGAFRNHTLSAILTFYGVFIVVGHAPMWYITGVN
jgi:hypothetical protein